jgi:hypothetical protein
MDRASGANMQNSVQGTVQYLAWYRFLPFDPVEITSMEISPGDEISASISLEDSFLGIWSIRVSDLTTGEGFNQFFAYNSSKLSAEWVVERPNINDSIGELANFGNVTMKECQVTIADETSNFGYFPSVRFFMYDLSGTKLADVTYYSNNGSAFTVSYLAH